MIRIAIADDHALFRQGLRSMLRLQPDVSVVAEVERVDDIAPALERTPCDLLLLDLQLDRSALPDIAALAARVAIVVVTATERLDEALAAVRAGARGLVYKRYAIESLMTAAREVMAGHVWLPPEVQAALSVQLREPERSLTRREREIVGCVARGLRNAEVARQLGISELTVKTHLNNVFQKLGVRDRVELTLHAIRAGLVGVERPR